MAGIVGYGAYVPRHRIKVEEIAKVWGADAPSFKSGLMLREKSVPTPDQDTITMSVEAARHALKRAGNIDPHKIGAIYIGSESHPYAVKPSGTTVAEALGATPEIHCADLEFACKAGSEGMFIALSLAYPLVVYLALGRFEPRWLALLLMALALLRALATRQAVWLAAAGGAAILAGLTTVFNDAPGRTGSSAACDRLHPPGDPGVVRVLHLQWRLGAGNGPMDHRPHLGALQRWHRLPADGGVVRGRVVGAAARAGGTPA